MSPFLRPLAGLLLLGVGGLPAQSELDIAWGTSAIDQRIITSDGSYVTPGAFEIEIGAFDGGFVPTYENRMDWLDNWNVFDAITIPDADPADFHTDFLNDGTSRFAGSAHLLDNQTSDSEDALPLSTFENQQAYVFIREASPGPMSSGVEWALYTNEAGGGPVSTNPWVFPTVDGAQQQFPLSWFISAADTAVVGAVGDTIAGPTSIGGGSYTDSSTDFVIRTHLITPEPSFGVLLGCFGLLLLTRRAR